MNYLILPVAALSAALAAQPLLAQDMKPKAAGDAAPMMTMDRETFVRMVGSSNEFEIRSSELAKQSAGDAGIKEAADMIIKDHRKAGEKLRATLESKGSPPPPTELAPKHQKMVDQLQAAKGPDFDTLYLDMQAQAHMEAIGLFRTYAGTGEDQALVGFAKETLPSLETHLGHVQGLIASQ